jgi:hypothetical protein
LNLKKLSVLMVVALLGMMSVPSAIAQDGPATPVANPDGPLPSMAFGPKPTEHNGRFSVELQPGESATFTALLENNGEIAFDFVTYAADAYTVRNGGFGVLEYPSEPTGPTTWLDYPTETYAMEPGEAFERSFTVTVPDGALPGEYVTAIGMQTAEPVNAADEGMFRFDQVFRTVLGIRILVPGELKAALEVGEPEMIIEGSIPGILIPVTNTGNVRATPSGDVTVRDATDDVVISGPLTLGTIYGGHATEILIGLPAALPIGDYTLDLSLYDATEGELLNVVELPFEVDESTVEGAGSSPVSVSAATLTPLPEPSNVQLALIDATITNSGDPIANAQLSLIVSVDGVEVERFAINQSLALPSGETTISERYLPLTGWTSGEWTFELLLESVGADGVATVIDRHVFDEVITIP